ncbi:hypothetical protein FA15DRAFT_661546 [Coprinopsis marcescibilis]|uniref:BTB domain-containing protein n=1 Tax=Coprinopsis marcescibilis TaxID=230819 RepID=A0A5C3KB31_COPMA|nr:hypothetical protein FA15DRAFT_661546 [Coprinopsis marcescibilis]
MAFRETVSVVGSIRSILDNYPYCVGLWREILQNSDDAKAVKQILVLDCRSHASGMLKDPKLAVLQGPANSDDAKAVKQILVLDCRSHASGMLKDPKLAVLQGPAVLAFNDQRFEPEDWKALRTISESSKRADTSKIGKFGIGIRSTYHVTDHLQILSGDTMVTFDPQEALISDGAMVMDFNADNSAIVDHLVPFKYFLGENSINETTSFLGTVVRLPLRNAPSRLRDSIVTREEIKQLMKDFLQEEFDISMLFLQHLRSIELVVIDEDGRKEILGTCAISIDAIAGNIFIKRITVTTPTNSFSQKWLVVDARLSDQDAIDRGLGRSVLDGHKLRPHVGIAFRIDNQPSTVFGNLFTYLRLPLATGFPAHIHAFFALTPSRQNLRNPGDHGIVKGSDDSVLVEWNRVLFEALIPKGYASALFTLTTVAPEIDIFGAWPTAQNQSSCGESSYWNNFPCDVLKYVVQNGYPVWPTSTPRSYRQLQDVFVAGSEVADDVVRVFVDLGFEITRPPTYIINMLRAGHSNQTKFLTPETAAKELKNNYIAKLQLPATRRNISFSTILDYLLSANALANIIGIPIVPVASGEFVALSAASHTETHTLLEEGDAAVFSECDRGAVYLHLLSPSVAFLFRHYGPSVLNVNALNPDRVLKYLSSHPTRASRNLTTDTPDSSSIAFLSSFWQWFNNCAFRQQLRPKLSPLYLIPCSQRLRQAEYPVFKIAPNDPALMQLLSGMGVPILSPTFQALSVSVLEAFGLLKEINDVHALLDHLRRSPSTASKLSENDAKLLLKHFVNNFPNSKALRGAFTRNQQQTLKALPIFPVTRFYDVNSNNILPEIYDTTFLFAEGLIDYTMMVALNASSPCQYSELDVLNLSLQHDCLPSQSPAILKSIMVVLASQGERLSTQVVESLKKSKFLCAANGSLAAPEDLIDPSNPLYPLYSTERHRIPSTSNPFQSETVEAVAKLKLLNRAMTVKSVTDRIHWISNNYYKPEYVDKSLQLLRIIDEQGFHCGSLILDPSLKWIPTRDNKLVSANECRPDPINDERLSLFDRVLKIVHSKAVMSGPLKKVLGWDQPIATSVLIEQLRLVVDNKESCQRVIDILKHLGSRILTGGEVDKLKNGLDGKRWVPTSHDCLVEPSFAVLQHSFPEAGIYEIEYTLRQRSGVVDLLKTLGCSDMPSFSTIVSGLTNISRQRATLQTATLALSILKLAASGFSMTDSQRNQLLVPDDSYHMQPIHKVLFNDVGERAILVPRDNFHLAFPPLDSTLARDLNLDRLGLKFVNLQEPFEDMGADPLTLVQTTLRQYKEKQFMTEFLANAQDAGATKFAVIVNDFSAVQGKEKRLLCPEMEKFYDCPSVLVYNNSVFSDQDFEGICRTHVGGKGQNLHSIGQFGLGVLTMFHVAEVGPLSNVLVLAAMLLKTLNQIAIVISGSHALFIDPSKTYLPIANRTALKLPLKDLLSWYPDHLAPLQGLDLFNVDNKTGYYHGTLFMLPLRSTSHLDGSPTVSPTSRFKQILCDFREWAPDSLLFTKLESIGAMHRRTSSSNLELDWEFTAERVISQQSSNNTDVIQTTIVEKQDGIKLSKAKWTIVSSSLPPQNIPEARRNHPTKHVHVGLAASLNTTPRHGYRFFSTLPLAISTTLPVHVSASFALSPDRRQIRHDSYDTAETLANQWLLSNPLPNLYVILLEELARQGLNNEAWWPANYVAISGIEEEDDDRFASNQDDALTSVLTDNFYSALSLPSTRSANQRFLSAMFDGPPLALLEAVVYPSVLPSAVQNLLKIIQPITLVRLRIPSRLATKANFTVLTPEHFAQLLNSPQEASEAQRLDDQDLHAILEYLASSNVHNVDGLPFLRLQDKSWATFGTSAPIKFVWEDNHLAPKLFDPSCLVGNPLFGGGDKLTEDLIQGGINIALLDKNSVKELVMSQLNSLGSATDRKNWISLFWKKYSFLPSATEDLHLTLEDLPLVPSSESSYISLAQCKNDTVVVSTSLDRAEQILQIVEHLGVTVIGRDERCPTALSEILSSKEYRKSGTLLTRILLAMKPNIHEVVSRITAWNAERRATIADWFRSQIRNKPGKDVIDTMRQLPIWPAQRLGTSALKSALEVKLLPSGINDNAATLLNTFICTNDNAQYLDVERLSIQDLRQYLQLPRILNHHDEPMYRNILARMLEHTETRAQGFMVPNGNRVMVDSKTLYARQSFFEDAFGDQVSNFLFPSFSILEEALRTRHLMKQVDDLDMDIQIRHDSYDTAETLANQWLLSNPLPNLYVILLEELARQGLNNEAWWPANYVAMSGVEEEDDDRFASNQDDALTSVLTEGFYSALSLPSTRSANQRFLSAMFNGPPLALLEAVVYPSGLPSAVRKLLKIIRPITVVRLRIPSRLATKANFTFLTPEHFAQLLNSPQEASEAQRLADEDLHAILNYLANDKVHNLYGLPFLRLQDKSWTTFGTSAPIKFIWENKDFAPKLFDPSCLVGDPLFSSHDKLTGDLIQGGINIALLEKNSVKALVSSQLNSLGSAADRENWTLLFWKKYSLLPSAVQDLHLTLEDLPLVPSSANNYTSLAQCKNNTVLVTTSLDHAEQIIEIIEYLGITVINSERCPTALSNILSSKEYRKSGTLLTRILLVIQPNIHEVVSRMTAWNAERGATTADWFRSRIHAKPEKEVLDTIRQLPIWPAQRLGTSALKSALQVKLLPLGINANAATLLNTFICTNDNARYLDVERLSIQDLRQYLQLPRILNHRDEPIYWNILARMLEHTETRAQGFMVPNGNRVMVDSKTLYARQSFFEDAFGDQVSKFLLPSFSILEEALRTRHLMKQVDDLDMDMFESCANAFQADENRTVSQASTIFLVYCETLPVRLGANTSHQWARVDDVCFIPRNLASSQQWQNIDLKLPRSIRNLPLIVSPRQLTRKEFLDICWTQRVGFAHEPGHRVLIANPSLGMPTAKEVVEHLRQLVHLRKGNDILHYLKTTYSWLNSNSDEARPFIEQYHQENIFLNIDDPASEEWEWQAAHEMAFENHDVESIYRVRSFLLPYASLLKAAGVIDVKYPDISSQIPETSKQDLLEKMRSGFAEQRKKRQFTDVAFISEEDVCDNQDEMMYCYAHRTFLSIFSSYFEDMFTGGYAEGQHVSAGNPRQIITLPHSKLAITTVLDFLYTGDLISRTQEDIELEDLLQIMELSNYLDIKSLFDNLAITTVLDFLYTGDLISRTQEDIELEDLLQIMELSNYLDIKSLFDNVQIEIMRRKLIDPLVLNNVLERSKAVNAKRLVSMCEEYQQLNPEYIRRINQ